MDQNMEDSEETWLRQVEKEGKHEELTQGPGWAGRGETKAGGKAHEAAVL